MLKRIPIVLFLLIAGGCDDLPRGVELAGEWGSKGDGPAQFLYVEDIAITREGDVLVSDTSVRSK